ncbi:response regulator [Pseudobacteriovorax antillogorgiicola]|uniref:Response regulator receiver domain-containing protein n=1 Tax=Pseudobacteriovorax antillogorgiicola TaxID=1513793 RepID=A0A1Y6CNK7_9BACT|nr:response regulator [Pseudobacteriovorax antillogorgiicola]TCS43623.1 response regulator receiver domain-containing protein [Pseudobacteriovorax antillogorgiicola]SMF80021.1 Response regulator receiver domain-containing protein [Pseudobacteriovorax antillogorgiicola]
MIPKSILIVDDSDDFSLLVKNFIHREFPDCDISVAGNIAEAVELFSDHDFEIVVTDYLLGPELGSDIVHLCSGTSSSVMVLTGCAVDEVKESLPNHVSVLNKFSSLQNGSFMEAIKEMASQERAL